MFRCWFLSSQMLHRQRPETCWPSTKKTMSRFSQSACLIGKRCTFEFFLQGSFHCTILPSRFLASSFLDGPWSGDTPLPPPPPVLALILYRAKGAALPKRTGGRVLTLSSEILSRIPLTDGKWFQKKNS